MASLLMLEIITGYTRPVISLEINKTIRNSFFPVLVWAMKLWMSMKFMI